MILNQLTDWSIDRKQKKVGINRYNGLLLWHASLQPLQRDHDDLPVGLHKVIKTDIKLCIIRHVFFDYRSTILHNLRGPTLQTALTDWLTVTNLHVRLSGRRLVVDDASHFTHETSDIQMSMSGY